MPSKAYQALMEHAACIELAGWTTVAVRGADRATLLNNLSTNDIRSLKAGSGCEAFLTNVQARILAHV
jgi:folate-binding Fe-S cluster repair protein YgfZ